MNKLTKPEAIKIQTQHLNEWKSVLRPELHEKLTQIVTRNNDKETNPYEICRGNMIDTIIQNHLIRNHPVLD